MKVLQLFLLLATKMNQTNISTFSPEISEKWTKRVYNKTKFNWIIKNKNVFFQSELLKLLMTAPNASCGRLSKSKQILKKHLSKEVW